MARREFSKAVKVAAIKRAAGLCEAPGCGLPHLGRFEVDHVIADALGGEPTLANARVLCLPCHGAKTKLDTTAAAKVKRQEAAHFGAKRPAPARKIESAPLPASSKPKREPKATLPYRQLYRDLSP